MLSKEKVNEIKDAVNIVDIIGESVALTKAGRNFLGLCPFHGEKTPSFNVVEDKQFYHCFGCGKSGDVFTFIEEMRGLTFADSVAYVAEKAGIQLEHQPSYQQVERQVHPQQILLDIHQEANKFFHAYLMTTKMGEEARHYLHERGLDDEVIRHFQIGLAPSQPDLLYKGLSQKFQEADLLNSGLFNTGNNNVIFDAFQNRIIFPLADENGNVVAFSGRIWTTEDVANKQLAKYKNSRSTAIFNKSYELYHLAQAKPIIKKQREVYLMEGFMDVIAAHRAGIENAVASMGTALTREHVQHLAKFCKKVVIAYDGDKAGQAATAKALEELSDFQVEIVTLPNQMDPDEFIAKNGKDDLVHVLEKARVSDVEFLIDHLKPENPDNLQMQIEFVERIAPIVAKTPSITAQNTYIYKVADLLPDFDYQQVEQAVNNVRLHHRQQQVAQEGRVYENRRPIERPEMPHQVKVSSLVRTENQLLYRIKESADLLARYKMRDDFSFSTPELQTLFTILKENGEIGSFELNNQSEAVRRAWIGVLEERLPDELGEHEIQDLEENLQKEKLKRDNRVKSKTIREQARLGDNDAAVGELTQLIAQKRKLE